MPGKWWGVITASDVLPLATAILDVKRQRPIIVVTTATNCDPETIPQVTVDEAEELRRTVGDIADVAIVATGKISFDLEAALPPHWHIFNGACRSYPAGILADPNIHRSPLRRRKAGEVASEQVISDALGHALSAGVFKRSAQGSIATTAKVKGFLLDGERALVDVGSPLPAVVWRDMTSPGIPLDWLIAKGSTVPGELDREHNRFSLRKKPFGPAIAHEAFPHGSITLALVGKVSPGWVTLQIHPDLTIAVPQKDVSSNPLDVLDLFFVEGEVVRARVVHQSSGKTRLRLSDVDEDELVVESVAVVEGGTPWLVEDRNLPAPPESSIIDEAPPVSYAHTTPTTSAATRVVVPAPSPAPVPRPRPLPGQRPVPGPGPQPLPGPARQPVPGPRPVPVPKPRPLPGPRPQHAPPAAAPPPTPEPATAAGGGKAAVQSMSMKIATLTAEIERLRRATNPIEPLRQELDVTKRLLRDSHVELSDARERITNFKKLHKQAVLELRKKREKQSPTVPQEGPRRRRDDWPDEESWLRHEIHLAWVERVPQFEKLERPLPTDYIIGPRFAASISTLDDGQFDKAMKCVVDVLTDRAKDIAGRDLHRLRSGDGGSDARRVRADDGGVAWRAAIEIKAAAARRLHYWAIGSRIELSQVAIHDDMEA